MKKIVIINGHPNLEALGSEISKTYTKAAIEAGHQAKLINLAELNFDPILHKGYATFQALETDLVAAQIDIKWADHIVIVFPIWWGSVPALLKGFLDRAFLPGFGFKYKKDSPFWDKLLEGRSGRLIFTTDAPWWANRFMFKDPALNMMKRSVFEFCGVKPVSVTQFDSVKSRTPKQIAKYLEITKELGKKGK